MNFGIVGTNFVSDTFMEGAALVPECRVVSVCSGHLENAEKFAKKYNIENVYESYRDMCASGTVDAVYIATPNSTHKEIACYFMSHGVHVLCEKPMASNAREVEEMIECARERRVYLHEGIFPLFTPNFDAIRDNLHRVGKIRQVTFNMSQYSRRYDAYLRGENPTTFRRELSNGAMLDLGIYVFALAISLFGMPKDSLSASNLLPDGADVSGAAILCYDGFSASLSYSKASDTRGELEIAGEGGLITIGHATKFLNITYRDRKSGETTELYKDTPHPFSYQIRDMIENIKEGRRESERLPLELSLNIHKVITESRIKSGIIFPCD